MKRLDITLLLFLIVAAFSTKTYAYNIAAENADGVTIYYDYTKNKQELSVTKSAIRYTGSVVIPSEVIYKGKTLKVTSIDIWAFEGCSGLTSIEIPGSVTSIGENAFYGCNNLTKVIIPDIASWCGITFGGSFGGSGTNPLCYAHHLYSDENTEITELVIPNGVPSIGRYAFQNCTGLTSIEIPSSVTSIGERAFSGCSGLTSIEIPSSVTSISSLAFSGCTGLTSIHIPSSVTSIGSSAFSGCTGLTSIEIPSSVTSIGYYAFSGCTNLSSIEIPSSVTSIDERAFSGCYFMIEKFTNNSLLSSNSNWGATLCDVETDDGLLIKDNVIVFCRRNATSIIIPSSVTSIGSSAFSGCIGLTSINIPSSITSIGDYAFSDCTELTSIKVEGKRPAATTNSVAYGIYDNCTLYVPEGSENAYYVADGWKEFENIVTYSTEPNTKVPQDVNGDGVVDSQDVLEIYQYMQEH